MKPTAFNYTKLGNNIRFQRIANHMTQGELAQKTGCSLSTISNLERGTCSLSVGMLFKIAYALKCRPSELVEGI